MTDLMRAAAQQALEALERTVDCGHDAHECANVRAITALRAALAAPVQEPVAWLSRDDARLALWEAINKREFGNPTDDKLILDHLHQQGLWIGKYTAPPQRLPLTDEEIFAIENDIPDDVIGDRAWTIWLSRAVERAHKIGGQP